MLDLGIIAAVVLVYGLASQRLERTPLSAPMVFVGAGILAGPAVFDLAGLELTSGPALTVAEVALVVVLFADASRIDLRVLRGNAGFPLRLLGLGMPLTIAAGVLAASLLLTELDLWEAAVIATILAPTDAALGQAVVSSELVPARVRQALNVESGLNDGLSIPFLFLFLALAMEESERGAPEWIGFAAQQIGVGALVGVVAGALGGWLVENATRRDLITGAFQQLSILAIAVLSWAAAEQIGGNGFIAAFSGGLVVGRITTRCGKQILDFAEDEGQLLNLAVFFIFGVAALEFLAAATWEVVLFGALSLTIVRMVPAAVSLLGSGLRGRSIAFIAWFGPRGLASIILALVVLEEAPGLPGIDLIMAAMTVTVLASVVAHGVSAQPLVRRYARSAEGMQSDAPEMGGHPEIPTRGGP